MQAASEMNTVPEVGAPHAEPFELEINRDHVQSNIQIDGVARCEAAEETAAQAYAEFKEATSSKLRQKTVALSPPFNYIVIDPRENVG